MRGLRNLWPDVRDAESARVAARQAFQVAAIVAALDAVFGVMALAGVKVGPFDAWILFDGSLFAVVAWRTYRPSKVWSVIGLALMLAEMGYKVAAQPTTVGAISVFLLLGSINGVRGAFAYSRFVSDGVKLFCIYCGQPCETSDAFCLNCGQPVPPQIRSSLGVVDSTPTAEWSKFRRTTVWVIAGLSIVALATIAYFTGQTQSPVPTSSASIAPVASAQILDPAKFASSVLTLYCYDKGNKLIGQGSGFVIRRDGVAVTDWHVAKKAFSIVATDGAGRSYTVSRYVNVDPTSDLVLLQLANNDGTELALPSLAIADSRRVSPGLKIYTISAPNGLSQTLSDGLLSAIRSVDGMQLLQITAPVSPGSSGGPVLNADGEAIGVIEGLIPSGQQLNFAIPIDAAVRLLNGAPSFVAQGTSRETEQAVQPQETAAKDFERGRVALGAKNYPVALRIFTTYLKSHPQEGAAAYNAALAYAGLNDGAHAASYFKIFLTLAPENDPDLDTAKKWIAAFEDSSAAVPERSPQEREDPLSARYRLVGSVSAVNSSLRLTIAKDGAATGQITIEGVLQDTAVVGVRDTNGRLTLRLSDAATLTGAFDGQRYAGTIAIPGNATSEPFEFRVQVKY